MPLVSSEAPPKGYITVQKALDLPLNASGGERINIIGVVVDFWDPKKSKGSDMLLNFRICDKSVTSTTSRDALKIRFFYSTDSTDQRRIHSNGDLVILRDIKLIDSGGRVGVANSYSELVLVPANKVPAPHFNDEFASGMKKLPHESSSRDRPPTAEEQMYVIALHRAWETPGGGQNTHVEAYGSSRGLAQPVKPKRMPSVAPMDSTKDKFRLLSAVEENKFYNVAVEVVKKFPLFDKCEIHATDYTENSRFYDYGKERGEVDGDPFNFTEGGQKTKWKGPHGQRSIQILLYEPHASHCIQKISERDLVFIRNVRIKVDRNGWRLEGVLHQDKKYLERVDIVKPQSFDDRMTALKRRRDEYWKTFGNPFAAEPESKNQRKKSRKQKKAKQEQTRKGQEAEDSEADANGPVWNSYVQTEKTQVSPTCLADIVDNAHYNFTTSTGVAYKLPFINAKFRTQVRVVDFFPHNLADFSRSLDDPSYNDVLPETQSSGYIDMSESQPRWEWAFYILVEDAKQPPGTKDPVRIPILIAGLDAEYLLRLTANDLRHDPKTLGQLKEKLFVLWGNLEELKSQSEGFDPLDDETRKKRQDQPFECLIKQYGVKVPCEEGDASLGYHRMFRMFGTTIK